MICPPGRAQCLKVRSEWMIEFKLCYSGKIFSAESAGKTLRKKNEMRHSIRNV